METRTASSQVRPLVVRLLGTYIGSFKSLIYAIVDVIQVKSAHRDVVVCKLCQVGLQMYHKGTMVADEHDLNKQR